MNAVVTSGGRIFTIFDEGPTGVFKKLPQKCMLVARDAFSGVLLWKQPMRNWQIELGTGYGNRWQIHHTIPRRLVAKDDRVYVTLGFLDSPVSVLDAATGEILTEAIEGTRGADEMVLLDDVLVVKTTKALSVGASARFQKDSLDDAIAAIDVTTNELLWSKPGARVVPYTLAARDGRAVYHSMDEIICVDLREGRELWRTPYEIKSTMGGISNLVLTKDVVLFYGSRMSSDSSTRSAGPLALSAFSAEDGKLLWQCGARMAWAGACTQPADLFVIDDLVYCGSFDARDVHTGEVKKTLEVDKFDFAGPSLPLSSQQGNHALPHFAQAGRRVCRRPRRQPHAERLATCPLFHGDHARQRALLRSDGPVLLLSRREIQRLLRAVGRTNRHDETVHRRRR